jgi:hypothetical protein
VEEARRTRLEWTALAILLFAWMVVLAAGCGAGPNEEPWPGPANAAADARGAPAGALFWPPRTLVLGEPLAGQEVTANVHVQLGQNSDGSRNGSLTLAFAPYLLALAERGPLLVEATPMDPRDEVLVRVQRVGDPALPGGTNRVLVDDARAGRYRVAVSFLAGDADPAGMINLEARVGYSLLASRPQ